MGKNDYLQHWGIAKGGTKQNHRYYKRVDSGNPKKPYLYFYSAAEYQAWLQGKQNVDKTKAAVGSLASAIHNTLSKAIGSFHKKSEETVDTISEAAKNVTEAADDAQKSLDLIKDKQKRDKEAKRRQKIGEKYLENDELYGRRINEDSAHYEAHQNKIDSDMKELSHDKEPANYKYIAKILIHGKYRYFYDKADLDSFYNRNPDLKDPLQEKFDTISDPQTEYESQSKINPNYMKNVKEIHGYDENGNYATEGFDTEPGWSSNCYDCTLAYEARRRGLDVEAIYDTNGGTDAEMSSFYEGVQEPFDYENSDEGYYGNKHKKVQGSGWDVSRPAQTSAKRVEQFADDLAKKYPDGARGNLCVDWDGGGGHSMAWEKRDGEIYIHDAQNNTITRMKNWSMKDQIANRDNGLYALRTDNKKFTETATKYLQPSDDEDEVKNTRYAYSDNYVNVLQDLVDGKAISNKKISEAQDEENRIYSLDMSTILKDIYKEDDDDSAMG